MKRIISLSLLVGIALCTTPHNLQAHPRYHRSEESGLLVVGGALLGGAIVGITWFITNWWNRTIDYNAVITSTQKLLATSANEFEFAINMIDSEHYSSYVTVNPIGRMHMTLDAIGKDPNEAAKRVHSVLRNLDEQQRSVLHAINRIEKDKEQEVNNAHYLSSLKTLSSQSTELIKTLKVILNRIEESIPLYNFLTIQHKIEASYRAVIAKNPYPSCSYTVLNDVRVDINNKGRGEFPYHQYLKALDNAISELEEANTALGNIRSEEASQGHALIQALQVVKQEAANTHEFAHERQMKFQIEREREQREHIERIQKEDHKHRERELKIHLRYDEAIINACNAQRDLANANGKIESLQRDIREYQAQINILKIDNRAYNQQIVDLQEAIKNCENWVAYYQRLLQKAGINY